MLDVIALLRDQGNTRHGLLVLITLSGSVHRELKEVTYCGLTNASKIRSTSGSVYISKERRRGSLACAEARLTRSCSREQ